MPGFGSDAPEMQAGIGNGERYPPETGPEHGFRQIDRAETSHQYDFSIPKTAMIPTQSTSHFTSMFTKF
jgi:hypothetical protein